MLSDGAKPDEIINNSLIPAINEVGELFNQKKYFLPQLIGSANTMKLAIEHLEPLLEKRTRVMICRLLSLQRWRAIFMI